jgi:hypothetical protein
LCLGAKNTRFTGWTNSWVTAKNPSHSWIVLVRTIVLIKSIVILNFVENFVDSGSV